MIKLDHARFQNAIRKALETKPAVKQLDGDHFAVKGSETYHVITITHRSGAVWGECTCKAHTMGEPKPCYHIASAVLAF